MLIESPLKSKSGSPPKVLLVGLGMIGFRFCQRLLEKCPELRENLIVVGEEEHPAYDRVQLSSYFSRQETSALYLAPLDWYREQGIKLLLGRQAVGIDRGARELILVDGSRCPYDYLVLATGSTPFGSLLGLEAAKALLDLGLETHVLEAEIRLQGAPP